VADVVRELLITEAGLEKLAARGIAAAEAEQVLETRTSRFATRTVAASPTPGAC
jgi:hypothetical protein